MKQLLLAMRPKQWVKNFFVFLPLVFGGQLFIYPSNLKTAATFCLFCLLYSAVYLVNDLVDRKSDMQHPVKKLRPIASGAVKPAGALSMVAILLIVTLPLAFALDRTLGFILVTCFGFNLLYTVALKKVVIVDVFCLGIFFILRVLAGAAAAAVSVSHWIIFLTFLLALFLGFSKRRHEVMLLKDSASEHRSVLTEYSPYFIDQIISVITASIVVAYMLYTIDARTVAAFGTKHLMYTIPFAYYGIFRYLFLVHRRGEGGDPTQLLLTDLKVQLNIILWITTAILVIYFKA
jgi:4-hydroxybenzoate polyprenyltransferase